MDWRRWFRGVFSSSTQRDAVLRDVGRGLRRVFDGVGVLLVEQIPQEPAAPRHEQDGQSRDHWRGRRDDEWNWIDWLQRRGQQDQRQARIERAVLGQKSFSVNIVKHLFILQQSLRTRGRSYIRYSSYSRMRRADCDRCQLWHLTRLQHSM